MSPKRIAIAAISMIVVVGVITGIVTGAVGSLGRAGLYATGLWSTNGPSTLPSGLDSSAGNSESPTSTPTPTSTSPAAHLPRAVLAPADPEHRPDGAKLRKKIRSVKVKGAPGSYSGSVIDISSGKVLFAHNATRPYIPASTMKLLTSTAALSILGPEHRFKTSVVSPKAGRIILVGGGDPYLAKTSAARVPKRASITDLAQDAAQTLKKRKIKKVRLGYDASLFRGPAWNRTWPTFYGDQVTRTSALWVDEGRVNGGSPGPRVNNPTRQAAEVFAAALRRHGIAVTITGSERAKASATVIASVSSMPLERIVERILMVSDNDAAEVVFRQAAIGAGKKGSIADATKVVRARLTKLGIWDAGTKIYDGSGLARQTKVPADTMVKLLRAAAADKQPGLRAVLTGLPVAGVEGSLRSRYSDDQSVAGRGLVRGKTGTLREVHTLAGFVRSRDGSLLAYAFLINDPKNEFGARVWLDRVTAAISTCGCR